jgi:hypothetical protein
MDAGKTELLLLIAVSHRCFRGALSEAKMANR